MASSESISIEQVVFDVDGVMTGSSMWYSQEGKLLKAFSADDADALKLLSEHTSIAFVSADHRGFPITSKRISEDMGWDLSLVSSSDRVDWISAKCELDSAAYMGDSFTDIKTLKAVGVGIAPNDALPGVLAAAEYVTSRNGGDRAVAEACFYLLVNHFGRSEFKEMI